MRSRIYLALAFVAVAFVAPMPAHAVDDWIVRESAQSVGETVARLEEAITRSGSVVMTVYDHQAAAREVGHELPGSTVVVFAKPRTSSPLIGDDPRSAIDMPQRILVWEEGGTTYAGFVSPNALVTRYGFEPTRPELEDLRSAMESLLAVAVSRQERPTSVTP